MNSNQIRYFMAIADYHSLHKAAAHLNSNASTLKNSITAFEKEIGAKLFFASIEGSFLTPSGERLYQSFTRMNKEYADCINDIAQLSNINPLFRLGYDPDFPLPFLQNAVEEFNTNNDHFQIEMVPIRYTDAAKLLRKHEIDFFWSLYLNTGKKLKYYPVYEDRPVAIHKGKPLASEIPFFTLKGRNIYVVTIHNSSNRTKLKKDSKKYGINVTVIDNLTEIENVLCSDENNVYITAESYSQSLRGKGYCCSVVMNNILSTGLLMRNDETAIYDNIAGELSIYLKEGLDKNKQFITQR